MQKMSEVNKSNPITITMVVVFYFTISISTVFVNKLILDENSHFSFPYPLTTTLYQLIVALACILFLYPLNTTVSFLSFFPNLEFNLKVAKQVAPLSVVYVCMLAFNNLCLNYVDVHLYQIARSLSICFTVLFAKIMFGESNSYNVLFSCVIVFVGYVIGAIGKITDYSKLDISLYGLLFGLLSSAFVSLNSIYVKQKLSVVRDNQWVLLIYNTVLAILLMFILALFTGELSEALAVDFLFDIGFVSMMTFSGLCGFLINIAFFLQIKYTSPLTNTISGTAKACLQTILAFFIFKNKLEPMSMFGLVMSIVGFGLYSNFKRLEMIEKNLKKQVTEEERIQNKV